MRSVQKEAAALITPPTNAGADIVVATLAKFGRGAIALAHQHGIRIRLLGPQERFADVSPAIFAFDKDFDRMRHPPAGLFVVAEKTMYLRSKSPMTVAHEFGHALDCSLGNGIYQSTFDSHIRQAFQAAKRFVTPYAASSVDEYFAESIRAYVEVDDPASPWPAVTRKRLAEIDPAIYSYIKNVFASWNSLERGVDVSDTHSPRGLKGAV